MENKIRTETEVKRCLRQLGFRKPYRGMDYLASAVEIVMNDPDVLSGRLVNKWLCPTVGQKFHTSGSGVEASIRWLLSVLWRSGDRDAINRLTGHTLSRRPTNCEFIGMMAEYMSRKQQTEPK